MTPAYGPAYTVPGMSLADGRAVVTALQQRLNALNGPRFIAVHQMLGSVGWSSQAAPVAGPPVWPQG